MNVTSLAFIIIGVFLTISVSAADILFFNQDCNVDLAGADNTCEDERQNLLNLITAEGHNITILPNFHQPDFANILAGHDFLMIPDMEDQTNCNVGGGIFITPYEQNVLKSYIEGGGSLLIAGSSQNINFLNNVFGLSLSNAGNVSTGNAVKNTDEAAGTPYENCPNSIPNIDVTFLVTSSMPENKRCIYEYDSKAAVALFSIGSGRIVYLGYDFNDSGPGCSQEASLWSGCVIETAVEVAEHGPAGMPDPIPTLSQWGLIILGLFISIFGVVGIMQQMLQTA